MKSNIKEKNNRKKKKSFLSVVIFIIIVVAVFLLIDFMQNNKGKETTTEIKSELTEFEKVALYNYVENEFLDYSLLQYLKKQDMIPNQDVKLSYAIEYTMKQNNSNKASKKEVINNYEKIFGNNLQLEEDYSMNISNIYQYNEKTENYEKQKNELYPQNELFKIKIAEIMQKSAEENIVKLDILAPKSIEEFTNYYRSSMEMMENNQEIISKLDDYRLKTLNSFDKPLKVEETKEINEYLYSLINKENVNELTNKVASAELTLKVNGNSYAIVSYTEQNIEPNIE